jgi:GUN4-like
MRENLVELPFASQSAMPESEEKDSDEKKPKKEEKPPGNEVLGDLVLKLLPLLMSGGVGGALSLIGGSNLPKMITYAGIGSFCGSVTMAASAIAKPFTTRIQKGTEIVAESVASKAQKKIETWQTSLSGFEKSYLTALQTDCYSLEVEGFRGNLPPLALADVFVPLRLETDRGNVYGQIETDTRIWDFLPQDDEYHQKPDGYRFAIVADPGYGKTTLTRYLASNYSCPNYQDYGVVRLLPVLLRFRDIYGSIQGEAVPKLEDLAVTQIKSLPECGELPLTQSWMQAQLKAGKCLVMLDGLDEVPEEQREKVSRWANRQMQEYKSFFLLTSRPHGYDASLFRGVKQLGILDFTNDQKRTFLQKWYQVALWEQKWKSLWQESQRQSASTPLTEVQSRSQSDVEAQKAATSLYQQLVANLSVNTQLAVNPLLLTIIAATHKAFEMLPERRVTLYGKMFNLLLEDRLNLRPSKLKLKEARPNQLVLQVLALKLCEQGETQFTTGDGTTWIKTELAEQCGAVGGDVVCTPQQFLRGVEQVAGLLTGGDSDLYQFSHKTFQEYLAAAEIRERGWKKVLTDRLQSGDWKKVEDWQEVFSFYAALESADSFVEVIQSLADEEFRRQILKLLYRIVKEEKSCIKKPELREYLDDLLVKTDFTDETGVKLMLEMLFQEMKQLDQQSAITTHPITWGEYQQFLADQNKGRFHSTAAAQAIHPGQIDHPVTDLSKIDRRWFCAWLVTQSSLRAENSLVYYDLPTSEQLSQVEIPSDQHLYIVSKSIPREYEKLLNYLAGGNWEEADRETYRLMITAIGRKEGDYFRENDFQDFPCEKLLIIDDIWVIASGGRFGFSVQKKIWEECDSPGIYSEDWEKFGNRVGWHKQGSWKVKYTDLQKSPRLSPVGEFPFTLSPTWGGGHGWFWVVSLFSCVHTGN